MRLMHAAVLLVLSTLAGSCVTLETVKRADAHASLGMAYLNEKDPEGALAEFFKAEELLPRSSDIQHRIALAFFAKGMHEEAEARFQKAIKLNKDPFPEAHVNLSALYLALERYADAEVEARNALAVPTYREAGRAWNNLATAALYQDKLDEAEEAYRRILPGAPAFCPAWQGLAIVAERRKSYPEAVDYLKKATICDTTNLVYFYDLGRILNQMERYDEARPVLEKVKAESQSTRLKQAAEDLLRSLP